MFFKSLKSSERIFFLSLSPSGTVKCSQAETRQRKRKRQNKGRSIVWITLQADYHSCDEILLLMEQSGRRFSLYGRCFLFLEYSGLFLSCLRHGRAVGLPLFIFVYRPRMVWLFPHWTYPHPPSHSWWPYFSSFAMTSGILIASQEGAFREKYGNVQKHVYPNFQVAKLGTNIEFWKGKRFRCPNEWEDGQTAGRVSTSGVCITWCTSGGDRKRKGCSGTSSGEKAATGRTSNSAFFLLSVWSLISVVGLRLCFVLQAKLTQNVNNSLDSSYRRKTSGETRTSLCFHSKCTLIAHLPKPCSKYFLTY